MIRPYVNVNITNVKKNATQFWPPLAFVNVMLMINTINPVLSKMT